MAGWRRVSDGDDESAEPVDLIADGDRSEVEPGAARDVDWHALLRTGAAVVAALSLLWMGRSWADERSAARSSECEDDLQNVLWRWEEAVRQGGLRPGPSSIPEDVVARLVAEARECGSDLFADAVEFRFRPEDDSS